MADPTPLELLKRDVSAWNRWRDNNPALVVDLRGADLASAYLAHANLADACLVGANLTRAELRGSNLDRADLAGSILCDATFGDEALPQVATSCKSTRFNSADLTGAEFFRVLCQSADFTDAILRRTSFKQVRLDECRFLRTDWNGATILQCRVFGVSVWDMRGTPAAQSHLVVTPDSQPTVAVDDLETAQVVYLLLNNEKVRNLFDAIGNKTVLILGRFTEDRKDVLDTLRRALRNPGFLPIVFDFEKSTQRDFTETIKILAGLSRFVIADITNPKSSPLELQATVPDYMIPFVPILHEGEKPFSMFADLQQKYRDWVLDVLVYDSTDGLLQVLDSAVVQPAIRRADQLRERKAEGVRMRHVRDYNRVE
jgi:hypothetical protein